MRVDGRAIAYRLQHDLRARFASLGTTVSLAVLVLETDRVTKQFIAKKKEVGERVGVRVETALFDGEITTDTAVEQLHRAVGESDGVVVQLPIPRDVDGEKVLAALPASHDVDLLGHEATRLFLEGKTALLPPVVGALRHILNVHTIAVRDRTVVVVGKGTLVGRPAAVWFEREGASVVSADRTTKDLTALTQEADIIVLGAGSPGLLKPDMIKDGAIVLDAGTSESGGAVVGDADPRCEKKASLFTPTPGGIGPVAVTMLFGNLLTLIKRRS